MADARTIIVVGAGIGGLTAALALTRAGFRVVILEAAPRLEELGAGIQLSPNATRALAALGLQERLRSHVIVPQAVRIRSGRSGHDIAEIPLGDSAEARYGAPYWLIHRGDLQRVLLDAAGATPDIVLRLGVDVVGHRADRTGVTVAGKFGQVLLQERGVVLIGADGLWSAVRKNLGHDAIPRFRRRTAWRASVAAGAAAPDWRQSAINLWLGPGAHLVHYPVKSGSMINIVAIMRDRAQIEGWSAPGARERLLARFARWAPPARALLEIPPHWQTWSLFDLPPLPHWGTGPATLLGDAAHPMLPFIAQGGAMAIEDAWVLADELGRTPADPVAALRSYEDRRRPRTARAAREAARTGRIYQLKGPLAAARDLAMRTLGGARLQRRYDWLYDWPGG